MKGRCCVLKCKREIYSGSHKFPKDEELCQKWLEAIKRSDFKPSQWSKICCLHFKSKDYEVVNYTALNSLFVHFNRNFEFRIELKMINFSGNAPLHKILKKNAVPSKFDWTKKR